MAPKIKKRNCKKCDNTFLYTSSLRWHIREAHEKTELEQCNICGHKTEWPNDLLHHIRRMYSNQSDASSNCTRQSCTTTPTRALQNNENPEWLWKALKGAAFLNTDYTIPKLVIKTKPPHMAAPKSR